jgi:hypothetical protein
MGVLRKKMEVKKLKKNLPRFFCEPCDFKCYMKCDWDRHVMTAKHEKVSNGSNITLFTKNNNCNCGKQFKTNGGLWKHKKMCKTEIIEDNQIDSSNLDMNLIMQLLKQNDEFKGLMVEQNNKMMETFQELCKNIAKEVTIDKTL